MAAKSVISYLKDNLGIGGGAQNDFVRQWRPLPEKDKDDLKAAARVEADALGVELLPA